VALLHLRLPPEIHLSKARASLLRVTFLLDFGVPQITIEIDGIQVHASLAEAKGPSSPSSKSRSKERSSPREDVDYIPTVDDLAKSFIREEPEEEIKELEQELESQSDHLQDSISSSDDGDDESVAGMGAPLALPTYLQSLLNTALDRLSIVANNIDIEVQDHSVPISSDPLKEEQDSYSSVKFHVERIAIDSIASEEARVDMPTSRNPAENLLSKPGKRRLRIENIYARLISDAEEFISMSGLSRSPSPTTTRSGISSSQKSQSEPTTSPESISQQPLTVQEEILPSLQSSSDTPRVTGDAWTEPTDSLPPNPLTSSVNTIDDDRFADAASDDGLEDSVVSDLHGSHPAHDTNASSLLYDDDGLLDYAMQNDLIVARLGESDGDIGQRFGNDSQVWPPDSVDTSHGGTNQPPEDEPSTPGLLSVSALVQQAASAQIEKPDMPVNAPRLEASSSHELDDKRYVMEEEASPARSTRAPSPMERFQEEEHLSQSQLLNHDDTESMYMSAISSTPLHTSHQPGIPGGWDSSSSTSSHDTASDASAPIPESMIAGSILESSPGTVDDGLETPRPGTPQSVFSSPLETRRASADTSRSHEERRMHRPKYERVFLSIDSIILWFPLGMSWEQSVDSASESTDKGPDLDFSPPNLAEDSIFQGMPGSFSNYAYSTSSRGNPSIEDSARKLPNIKASQAEKTPLQNGKKTDPAISVDIGNVSCHVDFATTRVIFQMFSRVFTLLTADSSVGINESNTQEVSSNTDVHPSGELSVKKLVLAFRDRLPAQPAEADSATRVTLEPNPIDAILKITLSSAHAVSRQASAKTHAKLKIQRFLLSSLNHEIVAFQSAHARPRSRKSIGAPLNHLNNDIEIDYEQTKDRRMTIITRPVKILFDLDKLDEALTSFGGFSGVLELSASITSNHIVNSLTESRPPARPRGVHFKDSPPVTPQAASSSLLKVQIQVGEVDFRLKGKSCAVQLHTTSVRLAIRESNLRLKVSEVHLSGPYVQHDQTGAPLMVEIKNSTVNFLFVPTDTDLDRLISLIAPSRDPYENNEDILIDTLLQQRRKGSLLRAEIGSVGLRLSDTTQMKAFEALSAELAKLSKVTKYLPDDDRPGVLTLALIQKFDLSATVNERLGDVSVALQDVSVVHVGVPALFAAEVGRMSVTRGEEVLIHEVVGLLQQENLPMVMVRFVGDEMEPVIKAKLFNLCAEYRVSTVLAALGLSDDGTVDDIALGLASSVGTITRGSTPKTLSRQSSASDSPPIVSAKPLHIDVLLRNCALGLNPLQVPAKGLFVLTDAHFLGKQSKQLEYIVEVQLRKASIHAIDDIVRLEKKDEPSSLSSRALPSNRQLHELASNGYVSLGSISAANVLLNIKGDGKDQPQRVDVDFRNELLVLESCADSTQTLISILNGLQPPPAPTTTQQYRDIVPMQQMMDSISREAFHSAEDDDFMENADLVTDEVPTNLEYVGSFYNQDSLPTEEELGDSLLGEDDLGALQSSSTTRLRGDRGLLESFQERYEVAEGEDDFDFDEDYFKESEAEPQGKARKWSSTKNTYHLSNEFKGQDAPFKVRVRDVNIIWNIYEGYDWPHTRSAITQAVEDVEIKAEKRRQKTQYEDDDDFVEEDYLFNSVWIGVPVAEERGALAKRINEEINRRPDDQMSETGSYATSTATRSTGATLRPSSSNKTPRGRLKLERSKYKRVAFELRGVAVDLVIFPPDTGETVNSIDIRVRDCEIYDHIPKSNWKKFLTCQIDPSERELNRPMINVEFLTVKPVTGLAASELVIKVHILPLLLHIDQDALDFIKSFFAFKDGSIVEDSLASEGPFIQRLEVLAVKVDFHYKPRRVDYRGLRAGRTSELMNFFVLDGAKFTLKHVILYGIQSFDKLHDILTDIWTPDVTKNQLLGVLGGLAVVRPLVDVGSGVRDLIVIPVREYRKDGRVVRSIQKGIYAFATHTTSEVARLGGKVAIGTQNILEGAERFLNPVQASPGRSAAHHDWDGEDPTSSDSEEPRTVSHYANQPIGMRAGLQSAARHLQRDLLATRDAVIAMPAEVMEDGTGFGAARVLAKRAPTIVLRPFMGATKAASNTLLGLGNALDKQSRRKMDDVSLKKTQDHPMYNAG
jgi:autophagy-related protein 2